MTLEFDPAVTRVTVILDSPNDWFNWIFIRRDSCRRNDIWQYVDPETPKSLLPTLEEPSEPLVSSYLATATSLAQLNVEDRSSFRWDYDRYERKLMEYRKKFQAIAEFNLEISKTVSCKRLYIIQNCETVHDRLVALKKHLAPDVATRRHELTERYNALKIAPSNAKKIEDWLAEWTRITSMGKSINLPETAGVRPQEDFLIACKSLDQEYATTCLRDVYLYENTGKVENLPTLDDYVAEFTAFWRRNRPQSNGLVTVAADLKLVTSSDEDHGNANNNGNNNANRHSGSKNLPKCICGLKHWYSDCFIINKEHSKRPLNYKPPQAAQKRVDDARKDPKIEAKIQNALNKWRKRNQNNNMIQIDDGLPPSNYETFAVVLDSRTNNDKKDIGLNTHNQCAYNTICPTDQLTVMALEDNHTNTLLNRWIVDPGSNTHVINSESWKGWKRERENTEGRTINAGNSRTLISAWGRAEIVALTPKGLQTLVLTHVALVEGFLTSVLGLARCRNESIHFDSGRDVLYKGKPNNIVAQLEYNGGHWLIDADPLRRPRVTEFPKHLSSFGISHRPSHAPKPANAIDKRTAHQIWGHPSKKVIEILEKHVDGVSIIGGEVIDCMCQVCAETRLSKIISRRPAESKAVRAFYRIAIDLVYIVPMTEECWNGDRYMVHAIDEYTKWHEVSTIKNKSKSILMRWIKSVIRKIQRLFNADVCVIRSDNERGFGNDLINLCTDLGITFETAVKATPEQNGLAERSGGVLTARARAMRLQGNLPKTLANELYKTAAYILNRTPTEAINWKTPYEMVWGRKPLVAHLQPIGCRAYALNKEIKKADKMESRALIGHLVGYQGTNIFRIWLPTQDEVIVTRDVIFDSNMFFDSMNGYKNKSFIRQNLEIFEYPENNPDYEIHIEDLLTRRQRQHHHDISSVINREGSQVGGETFEKAHQNVQEVGSQRQLLTPGPSDFGDILMENNDGSDDLIVPGHPPENTEQSENNDLYSVPGGYRAYGEAAPQQINLNPYDTSLIITGKRNRRQAPNPNVFAIQTYVITLGVMPLRTYLYTFATETSKYSRSEEIPHMHQSQLPPPPKNVRALSKHIFGEQFKQALLKEWKSLQQKGCFRKTDLTKNTADAEVLPLMWVFTYKTSEKGYLASFKARLVVRGDLEEPLENTYAATLAIRNFRALMAIANYFDLELRQYDVPTAFLNATLNRKLYAETPDGLRHHEGEIMEVILALYGLKESPLLWYEELKKTLIKLGLKDVPGFPCLYTNSWLILFVYVDDIVMAFHKSSTNPHKEFEQRLIDTYQLKVMGDLAWFLGIRVIRDRTMKKTWLIQDAFIDKVCARFNIQIVGKSPETPLSENWLAQSTEETDKNRTKLYQQLVGSLAYIAVWGRPDVARAHVVLASHLTNPGQSHITKVKQVWRYLLGSKSLALQADASVNKLTESITDDPLYKDPLFFGSSDASYADEPETRRSSQGYLFKFGGMTIDWKATVQRTITKSTTESELLSLSLAGSQMREWVRFFERISLTLDCKPTIWCDNQQTVGIVTKSQERIHTKVKHVDIHQLWIRQEVEASRLEVKWVPTDKMPADGLTKILPRQKFKTFITQLGMVDIGDRLRRTKDIPIKNIRVSFPNSM